MMKSYTFHRGDLPLHYAYAAGLGPAVVIIHGITGTHTEFLHLVPQLSQHAQLYLIDLRGHGLSGHTTGGYDVAHYAEDVAAFLKEVVVQPAVIMGHSLGALVALALAARASDRVRGLILEDPPLYILDYARLVQKEFYPYFVGLKNYLTQHETSGATLEEMIHFVGSTPVAEGQSLAEAAGPEAVRERAIQLHQMDPAVLDPLLAGTLWDGARSDALLGQVTCPVHMVAADPGLDGAMDAADAQRGLAHLSRGTFMPITGAGHDIHLTQPAALVREITWFLETMCEDGNRTTPAHPGAPAQSHPDHR